MDEQDMDEQDMDDAVEGLVEVGALTEVGAAKLRARMKGGSLPKPPFAVSKRETQRRAPLGFVEDGTGQAFFSLPAVVGATTVMRGKVSRVTHIDRLLIVPSAPGVVIDSLKVGDEEQTLAAGVPVELYSAPALTDSLPDNFSPLGPALDFVATLKNTTAVAITGTIGCKAACKR